MPRPLLLTAIGVAGLVVASGVSVAATRLGPEPADAAPAPPTSVASDAAVPEAAAPPAYGDPVQALAPSLAALQASAAEVSAQVTVFVGEYELAREQLRNAPPGGTGTTRVGPTDVSTLLGIDNRIVWFDGIAMAPCAPYLLSSYGAYYCPLDDTIYIGSWVDTLTRGQRIFVYAHEDAHSEANRSFATVAASEAYADEQGGRRMAQLRAAGVVSAAEVAEARALLARIGDPDHGTGAQRVRAFDRGYASW